MTITHRDTRLLGSAVKVLVQYHGRYHLHPPDGKPQNRETTFERRKNELFAYISEGQADQHKYGEATPTAPTSNDEFAEECCNRPLAARWTHALQTAVGVDKPRGFNSLNNLVRGSLITTLMAADRGTRVLFPDLNSAQSGFGTQPSRFPLPGSVSGQERNLATCLHLVPR